MNRSRHFDRNGRPLTFYEWCNLFKADDYRRVAQDDVGDGCMVSTVWLGLDHRLGPTGPPLIFETMAFFDGEEDGCWRYSTETEAREGHARVVAELKGSRK